MRSETRNVFKGLAFLSPWIVGFLVFTLTPVALSVYYSFTDYSLLQTPASVGFDNYRQLWQDPIFWKVVGNTAYFAVLALPIGLCIAMGLALLLYVVLDGFDLGVPMELGPVVSRDRGDAMGVARQQLEQCTVGFGGCPRGQLANENVARFAFDQRQDAVAAFPETLAHHRVDFPMAGPAASLHHLRPLPDHPLPSQAPSAVVAPVALPTLFACTAQMTVQGPTRFQIPPDVPVDGLMADRQFPGAAQVPSNLFRTPLFPQQLFHPFPVHRRKMAVAP